MDNFKLKAISLKLKDKGVLKVLNLCDKDIGSKHKYLIFLNYKSRIFCSLVSVDFAFLNNYGELKDPFNYLMNKTNWLQMHIDNLLFNSRHYGGFLKSITSIKSLVKFIEEQILYLHLSLPLEYDIEYIRKNDIVKLCTKLKNSGMDNIQIFDFILSDAGISIFDENYSMN